MPRFLNLRDPLPTRDFIEEHLVYLSDRDREQVEEKLEAVDRREDAMPKEELAELAREVGRKSWAPRRALDAFLKTPEGCDEEWRVTAAAVSNSTEHLMERFRHGTSCTSLDQTLTHEESGSAFRDQERTEIAAVREYVRHALWQAHQEALVPQVKKQQTILNGIIKRLETLRQLGADAPWIQDQVFPKLNRYEDDLYFAGKELNTEKLDEEIAYYREEKELPAEG